MATAIILSVDSKREDYEGLFTKSVGTIFKVVPDDYETVMVRISEYRPDNITEFEVTPITPGTSLFTIYGPDHLIVTSKVVVGP